ncbi:hypothetical protein [Streptomyces sp. NPDC001422]|uniref:hypothetical protein n=1 Tax=Streptomyces sp. NPDC001422 TaxID=3364575 RepID=UPI0036872DDC
MAVFARIHTESVQQRLSVSEIQVCRPDTAFVSGKENQSTARATVLADHQRPHSDLWADGLRPGRMHDATVASPPGIDRGFGHFYRSMVSSTWYPTAPSSGKCRERRPDGL